MRISLIGPKWNEMINSYPPLGLGYLAAVAEQDGHDVRIHDFGLYPSQPLEEDARQVVDFKPDLVAFTSMTTRPRVRPATSRLAPRRASRGRRTSVRSPRARPCRAGEGSRG